DQGLAKAKELAAANPKSAEVLVILGELYLTRGDADNAAQAFTKASELRPDLFAAHLGLGMASYPRETAKAIAAYRKALTLAPNDPRAYNNLAWVYAEQKRNLDEALSLAKRATELAPNDASTLDTLGWVHYNRGAYDEAEPIIRKAAELADRSAPIQYHLGMTYYRLGRKDDAVLALRRALQLDPKLPEAGAIEQLLTTLAR